MADTTRDTGGVPEELEEREDTGVVIQNERVANATKITTLFERYKALKAGTLSSEQVREMVTNARSSIVSTVASKESVEALNKQVAELKPPSLWKVAGGILAFLLTVATIIWQASARVGDISLQNTILKMQVDGLSEAMKRLEAAQQATQSKVDQLLIHGAKP